MKNNFVIGLSGNARCGKDSLANAFIKTLTNQGIDARQYAFATELKKSINAFLLLEFGINAFTENSKEKEFIRPYLLTHGKQWREKDEDHWLKIVDKKIKDADKPHIAIVSDVRYSGNEAVWAKENGYLIHITRFDLNNRPIKPVGQDEEINEPKLKQMANFNFEWPTFGVGDPMIEEEGKRLCGLLFSSYYSDWQEKYSLNGF